MNLELRKIGVLIAAVGCLVAAGIWTAGADPSDTDGDGVLDHQDNCITTSNTAQTDPDLDGYGVRCDTDVDNSGGVGSTDVGLCTPQLGLSIGEPGFNANCDFDESGDVGSGDLEVLVASFGSTPGPSSCVPVLCN